MSALVRIGSRALVGAAIDTSTKRSRDVRRVIAFGRDLLAALIEDAGMVMLGVLIAGGPR